MLLDLVATGAGIAIVLLGGYLLVESAVVIAMRYGLSRAIVGATVVAFGTSAPELVVGASAAVRGADGVTVGNIIGACVGNVGLVLGLAAILNPAVLFTRLRRPAVPVLMGATALFLLVSGDGEVTRWEGGLLLLGLVGVAATAPRLFPELAHAVDVRDQQPVRPPGAMAQGSMVRDWARLAGGVVALAAGAQLALTGAVSLAETFGLSEVAIGVVIISLGTSLPETMTSVTAALRGEVEIAVSNVLGSNVFNLLGVMGMIALVTPVEVDLGIYRVEAPALIISTLALIPFALSARTYRITRLDGALLLSLYFVFVALVVDRGL